LTDRISILLILVRFVVDNEARNLVKVLCMSKNFKAAFLILLGLALALLGVMLLLDRDIAVLNPKGIIGLQERDLIILSTLLMMIIIVPVFILSIVISWKYRAGNPKAKYNPEWDHSHVAETLWWGVPFVIVFILGVITWKSCHDLDPFKPLVSDKKPLRIQVVALQWKWLFIYPEQNIATVNFVQFPEQIPLNFEITADAPMNSFWIPQLGSQIYAMPAMSTKLHLMANETGVFRGLSANLSGRGFASMQFSAKASSQEDFNAWVKSVQESPNLLTVEEYNRLVAPSEESQPTFYALQKEGLYNWILMKYMAPHE